MKNFVRLLSIDTLSLYTIYIFDNCYLTLQMCECVSDIIDTGGHTTVDWDWANTFTYTETLHKFACLLWNVPGF